MSQPIASVPVSLGARPARARSGRGPGSPGPVPTEGPLADTHGRVHTDLRISVTDRCNLRCVYCMPEEGLTFLPRAEILTFEEIVRVAKVARALGVRSVRFTGGEPLLRRGLVELVRMVAAEGFEDVALTTNGTGLASMARSLVEAGLRRVNISCDSLQPLRFSRIRRRGNLGTVLQAMDAAEVAGLTPLKVNVVVMAGVNDDEILEFCAFARDTGRIVRFIEYMPLDADGHWRRDQVVASDEILARAGARWPLEPVGVPGSLPATDPASVPGVDPTTDPASDPAPAERFRFADGVGEIGVVASVTRPFCGTCNRLRLTADGAIRNCLFSDDEVSVRTVLRNGGDDEDLAMALRAAVWGKLPGHGINDPGFLRPVRSMSMIGG